MGLKQTIVVVDDHEIVLGGTISLLKQHYAASEILTAQTASDALELVTQVQPDLVVFDLSIPQTTGGMAGFEL